MAVAKRLAIPTDRIDLLSKSQRDSEGKPMGREELTAERKARFRPIQVLHDVNEKL